MYGPWDIINQLEIHNSRLNKEAIIEAEATAHNTEFFEGCSLALDKTITFGLKQIPEKTDEDGQGLSWDAFTLALTGFVNRDITGNMARDMVNRMIAAATKKQWNQWYRRILIKDLRCGVSEKTINKAVEKINANFLVPVFTVQLANDSHNFENKLCGRKLVEVKLDGCLSEDWLIEFETGEKIRIKEVVDNRLSGKVKSYNTITGKIEYNKILNWSKDGVDDSNINYEWFEITLDNGQILPPLTGNHLIYIPKLKCYRRADLLEVGDEILLD